MTKLAALMLVACLLVCMVSADTSDRSGWGSSSGGSQGGAPPSPVYLAPGGSDDDRGPIYLASMINQLNTERTQIMGPTPVPDYELTAPPNPFSHNQLSNLYKNAVKHMNNLDYSKLQAQHATGADNIIDSAGDDPSSSPGYYYYYFPMTDQPEESNTESSTDMNGMMMGDDKNVEARPVEPLFVAMASFIGLSTLFAFSVLFLPKFGSRKRSDPSSPELMPLTNRVMEALEVGPERRTGEGPEMVTFATADNVDQKHGEEEEDEDLEPNDIGCRARLECELGRVLRKMKLHKEPLRALERILPSGVGKHVESVRKSAHRRDKCSTIRCVTD